MRKALLMIISLSLLALTSCSRRQETLTIYMPSNYSWLEVSGLFGEFERENDVAIKPVYFDGASKIVLRLVLEKEYPEADVVMGLNQVSFLKAKKENLLEKYRPKNFKNLNENGNTISHDYFATIFDCGGLAFIYNPEKIRVPLKSFQDIAKLKSSLVLPDPRTSTTGQDFLLWTIAVFGDKWIDYWKSIKTSIITVAPSWDSCFAKFETGEASIMVSYASDEAYSMYTYHSDKYRVFIPSEGGFMELEANALVKKEGIKEKAKRFIDFCLTDQVQKTIPLNNWMMPVTNVKLPEVFNYYKRPGRYRTTSNDELSEKLHSWVDIWSRLMIY